MGFRLIVSFWRDLASPSTSIGAELDQHCREQLGLGNGRRPNHRGPAGSGTALA